MTCEQETSEFVKEFNYKWHFQPFDSNGFYYALQLHKQISHTLTLNARNDFYANIYTNYISEITNMGFITKLLVQYYEDKFPLSRVNKNYNRLLFDNVFKLFDHVTAPGETTFSDSYEKKSIIKLLLSQTTNFEKESIESKIYLDKYKSNVLAYFLKNMDDVQKIPDFNNSIGTIGYLLRSLLLVHTHKLESQEMVIDELLKRSLPSFNVLQEKNSNLNPSNYEENEQFNENDFEKMFKKKKYIEKMNFDKMSKFF